MIQKQTNQLRLTIKGLTPIELSQKFASTGVSKPILIRWGDKHS